MRVPPGHALTVTTRTRRIAALHLWPLAATVPATALSGWLILGLVALAIIALATVVIARRPRGGGAYRPRPDPILVFPLAGRERRAPAPLAARPGPAEEEKTSAAPAEPDVQRSGSARNARRRATSHERTRPQKANGGARHANPPVPAVPPPAPTPVKEVGGLDAEVYDGHTIRFHRPLDGNVELLPGRLEIVEGEDTGQDIRFVRIRDLTPEVTFGRSSGPPHRHVQLRARTVSREHARMSFEQESWRIHNLSRTNPVLVNGQELDADEQACALRDGDLIEMGEVVFRYHERG